PPRPHRQRAPGHGQPEQPREAILRLTGTTDIAQALRHHARRPWRTTTVTVEATTTTTTGTPVASTRLHLEDDHEAGVPTLLARIPGTNLANANLPDDALLLTLKATPADQHCPTHIRLRIRSITPAAFAPRPPPPRHLPMCRPRQRPREDRRRPRPAAPGTRPGGTRLPCPLSECAEQGPRFSPS
ncbi:hypothetical protein AB1460_37485, partial [Parafrankia sp. FMc2]